VSIIGTISITHSVDCKACGKECSGGTLKAAYFWMILHLRTCEETHIANREKGEKPLNTLKALWQLWRWKQR
jgi:hypothetical protein